MPRPRWTLPCKRGRSHKLLQGRVVVGYADAPNVLYVQAEVAAGADTARAHTMEPFRDRFPFQPHSLAA